MKRSFEMARDTQQSRACLLPASCDFFFLSRDSQQELKAKQKRKPTLSRERDWLFAWDCRVSSDTFQLMTSWLAVLCRVEILSERASAVDFSLFLSSHVFFFRGERGKKGGETKPSQLVWFVRQQANSNTWMKYAEDAWATLRYCRFAYGCAVRGSFCVHTTHDRMLIAVWLR